VTSTIGVVAGVAGAAALGWAALVRVQGDSLIAVEGDTLSDVVADVVADVGSEARSLRGDVTLVNRGKAGGVVHRVEGRVVGKPSARVLVTRRGSRPPERGWWQSNCLVPGESCVAEVEVELDEPATGPVVVELDVHEVGRRLKVHRIARLAVPVPAR
jgi:hypothetical protein